MRPSLESLESRCLPDAPPLAPQAQALSAAVFQDYFAHAGLNQPDRAAHLAYDAKVFFDLRAASQGQLIGSEQWGQDVSGAVTDIFSGYLQSGELRDLDSQLYAFSNQAQQYEQDQEYQAFLVQQANDFQNQPAATPLPPVVVFYSDPAAGNSDF